MKILQASLVVAALIFADAVGSEQDRNQKIFISEIRNNSPYLLEFFCSSSDPSSYLIDQSILIQPGQTKRFSRGYEIWNNRHVDERDDTRIPLRGNTIKLLELKDGQFYAKEILKIEVAFGVYRSKVYEKNNLYTTSKPLNGDGSKDVSISLKFKDTFAMIDSVIMLDHSYEVKEIDRK